MRVDDVRVELYRWFIEEQRAPTSGELADSLGAKRSDVRAALRQLHENDVVALDGKGEVWLAHPFSAADDSFHVAANGKSWRAICVWDALGILALIGSDGVVRTTCPDCNAALAIQVGNGAVSAENDYVVHFGVPAQHWYDDIAFT